MSDNNKFVKTIMDSTTLTGLAAAIGWIEKKVVKENFTPDPSSNIMNYAKFTDVMAASIAMKQYLQDQKILPDSVRENNFVYKMASIAIMIGGAVLNSAAFTGGNYLAKYLASDHGQAALAVKMRHDKALEAYQAAMEKYTRERTQLLDWIETNREINDQAKQNFTNTDHAFKLYNQAHPDYKLTQPREPVFSDMYQPSELQKQGELLFVGGGVLALGYVAFRYL